MASTLMHDMRNSSTVYESTISLSIADEVVRLTISAESSLETEAE